MEDDRVNGPERKPPSAKPAGAPAARPLMAARALRLLLYLVVAMIGAGVAFLGWRAFGPAPGDGSSGLVVPPAQAPAIGGAFTLTDHAGRRVSDADYRGKVLLVYFGFTYCPDVCPTTLTVMADALAVLGPDAARVQPLFITVDPERDTPEQLAVYVAYFHRTLVGLTGSAADIAAAAKSYRVYYAKVKGASGAADDYVMDHTSIIYVMGPDGRYATHFSGARAEPEAIARAVRGLLK
jgi:protein SCO1/2